jgi:hypothetical protein
MDNKQDRKFYWSVKDFVKNPTIQQPKQKTPKITDAVKTVLEQNKPFTQSNFVPNSNTIDMTSQAISSIEGNKFIKSNNSAAHSANNTANPFAPQQLDESRTRLAKIGGAVAGFLKNPDAYLKAGAAATKAGTQAGAQALGQWARANPITAYTLGGGAALTAAALTYSALSGDDESEVSEKPEETTEPKPVGTEPKPPSFEDKLDSYRDAYGMPVPTYRPGKKGSPSNFPEWQKATQDRNAALRAANKEIRREREDVQKNLRTISAEKEQLRRLAKRVESPSSIPGVGIPNVEYDWSGVPQEVKDRYDELSFQQGEMQRKGRKISDLTSNDGLANTLRQQAADRQTRWADKLGQFKQETQGQDYDMDDPEHQNRMRRIMGFGSLSGKQVPIGPQPGEMDPITGESDWDGRYLTKGQRERLSTPKPTTTAPSKPSRGGVNLSDDTPDWVRRHAAKFGEESAREIEAMRLGVTSVLQGDPTQPMDYSLGADEVVRRGQLLDRDRRAWRETRTTSGKPTGIDVGKTASQPESTWDEVARRSVRHDSELSAAPLVRRGGRVFAQTANGEVELSTGSMMTSQYAENAPTREELNRSKK